MVAKEERRVRLVGGPLDGQTRTLGQEEVFYYKGGYAYELHVCEGEWGRVEYMLGRGIDPTPIDEGIHIAKGGFRPFRTDLPDIARHVIEHAPELLPADLLYEIFRKRLEGDYNARPQSCDSCRATVTRSARHNPKSPGHLNEV